MLVVRMGEDEVRIVEGVQQHGMLNSDLYRYIGLAQDEHKRKPERLYTRDGAKVK